MSDNPKKSEWTDPVTDEHYRAIGQVIVDWAAAERTIMDSLWEVSTGQSFEDKSEEASISLALVTGMGARVAMGILKAVFHARHFKDADEFNKFVDKLDDCRKVRDSIAHGRWIKGKRPREITCATFYSSRQLRVETHGFTPEEMLDAAERTRARTAELAYFLKRFGYWKTPAPDDKSAPENQSLHSQTPQEAPQQEIGPQTDDKEQKLE